MKSYHHSRSDCFEIEQADNPLVLNPLQCHTSLCIHDEGLLHTAMSHRNISRIDPVASQITYPGHDVTTLAEHADFPDVTVLLLMGKTHSASVLVIKRLVALYIVLISELPLLPFTHARNIDPVDTQIRSVLDAFVSGKFTRAAFNGPLPVSAFLLATIGLAIARYAQEHRLLRIGHRICSQPTPWAVYMQRLMNTLLLCLSRTAGWLVRYYDSVNSKAPFIRPQELYADEKK